MPYKCPRCSGSVQRGSSNKAQIAAGLVGALFYAAFGAFECKRCGKIEKSEFPAEVRIRMTFMSVVLVGCAIGLVVALVILYPKFKRT